MINPANFYINEGLSVIPCKDKRPIINSWKEYQNRIMSLDEAEQLFTDDTPQIAIIAGIVSGGLEVIDFDLKHLAPLDADLFWTNFNADLIDLNHNIAKKIQIHKTKSGGYHILYRCEEIEGNKKLAKKKIKERFECIIETRGEGGYIIAPPSKGYSCIDGSFGLSFLDTEERFTLISLCRSFNEEPEPVIITKKSNSFNNSAFKRSPFDDYNQSDDVLSVLQSHGWKAVQDIGSKVFFRRPGSDNFQSANWHREKKIFYVFSNGDPYIEGGKGYNASQIYTILQHKGDYKESYKALLHDGYGDRWSDDERDALELARNRMSKNGDPVRIKAELKKEWPNWLTSDIDKIISVAADMNDGEFWFINPKGSVSINTLAYVNFLHNTLGYSLYADSMEVKKPLIKIDKELHQVELIKSNDFIKRDVSLWLNNNMDDLSTVTPDDVITALMSRDTKLFSENTFEWLPAISFTTFKDSVEFAYFFFKNGIVKVSADKIELTHYNDLPDNTFIWKDRIRCKDFDINIIDNLGRDFYLDKEYLYTYKDLEGKSLKGFGCAWYKYIRRISGIGPEFDDVDMDSLSLDMTKRLLSTMSIIGYLLHSYKDTSRPWAIIINEDTPEDGKGGGSGKQIFTKGIGQLRNLLEEDGRQLNVKGQFAFQSVSEDHDIYVLDDVSKWFKLDAMYRMITNDMVIEERNKGRKTISFYDSPKFIFSTNYDITGTEDAQHLKRRVKILLFECYFGKELLPINEIGMLLKDGWSKDDPQWTLFYNFMFRCCAVYLNSSVIELPMTENTKQKAIRDRFGSDFFEFMDESVNDEDRWIYDWVVTKPLFAHFKEKHDSKMSLATFKERLITYFKIFNIPYEENKRYKGTSSFETIDGPLDFAKQYDKQHAFKLVEKP